MRLTRRSVEMLRFELFLQSYEVNITEQAVHK